MPQLLKFSKNQRRFLAIKYALKYPSLLKRALHDAVAFLYAGGQFKCGTLKKISPSAILSASQEISLLNCCSREGNVSSLELLIIASLIAEHAPLNLLEIGTFDGNTTLQMALNSPVDSLVHTIDLEESHTALPLWEEDLKYLLNPQKRERKYLNTGVKDKIIQHLADSSTYDFSKFTERGKIDFCFIDGGHSYACVKRDTEKTLSILSERGLILWHDFNPNCPGVFQFLREQAKSLPLLHIEGTALVLYSAQEQKC